MARVSLNGAALNGGGTSVTSGGTFSTTVRIPDIKPGTYDVVAEGFAPQTNPPTQAPPTEAPPTEVPPTEAPPTAAPPTQAPATVGPPVVPPVTQPTSPPPTTMPTTAPSTAPTTAPTAVATPTSGVVTYYVPTQVVPPNTVPPTTAPTQPVIVNGFHPSPTPTPGSICTGCSCTGCDAYVSRMRSGSTSPDLGLHGETASTQPAGTLAFDGDRASAKLTITAPAQPPISVSQSASCAAVPTVGVTDSCLITMVVTNTGTHTLDFSHTVVNHVSAQVRVNSVASTTGTIVASGNNVVWNNFQLAPGQSVSATVSVSFTPSSSQAGGQIVLSTGVTAEAVDVVTGERFTADYGALSTPARVTAASTSRSQAGRGGAQGKKSATSSTATRLPQTGGAAR